MSSLVFEADFLSCLWRNQSYNVIQHIASKHPECNDPASHTLILISKTVWDEACIEIYFWRRPEFFLVFSPSC